MAEFLAVLGVGTAEGIAFLHNAILRCVLNPKLASPNGFNIELVSGSNFGSVIEAIKKAPALVTQRPFCPFKHMPKMNTIHHSKRYCIILGAYLQGYRLIPSICLFLYALYLPIINIKYFI